MPGWIALRRVFTGVLVLCLGAVWPSEAERAQQAQGAVRGEGPGGGPLRTLAPAGERVVVLFFVASDCPVSNRTFPEMVRVSEEFEHSGVRFWFVYPNEGETPGGVRTHQDEFAGGLAALRDPTGALVRLAHAVATPETAVLVRAKGGWQPVYAGRIDDRFVHLGVERPMVTRHFAEEAVRAVLAGQRPPAPEGAPVGCAIMSPGVR